MTLGQTIKRSCAVAAVMATTLAVGGATASAHGADAVGQPPAHGHVMLLDAVWTGSGPGTVVESYAKCVDLAGGNVQPSHHTTVHTGRAGHALRTNAGHLVIPMYGGRTCADMPN